MRTFTDRQGRDWDVVTGRESWGSIFAIFIPRDRSADASGHGSGEIRQTPLRATGYEEGNRELETCSEEDLQGLLDRSDPKETG